MNFVMCWEERGGGCHLCYVRVKGKGKEGIREWKEGV